MMTIKEVIEHLKTYPEDAEVVYAEVTAWTKDNDFIQWVEEYKSPDEEVKGE